MLARVLLILSMLVSLSLSTAKVEAHGYELHKVTVDVEYTLEAADNDNSDDPALIPFSNDVAETHAAPVNYRYVRSDKHSYSLCLPIRAPPASF